MNLKNYFRFLKKDTASVAKERLQIIISHERNQRSRPDFLSKLQQEIIKVIARYVDIDEEQVKVQLEQAENNAILELNITLPDKTKLLAEEEDEIAV